MFDEIDHKKGVTESLESVLAGPLPLEPWRSAVIEQPEVIDDCWKRNILLQS